MASRESIATKSSERRVRYAVVGLGNIAQVAVLPSFAHASESSELAALVSSDVEKLDELGKRYDVRHRGDYADLEEILAASEADAVYLAVPNTLHREYTERCAKAGVHVLCEKPMAMTTVDCEAMNAACKAAGVFLMVAYRLHFEEATLRAIELVRSGALGDIQFYTSVFGQEVREGDIRTRAKEGGGALFDMGIYCVNAVRNLFGEEPTEVVGMMAEGDGRFEKGVDATTTTVIRFPSGRLAQLTASQASTGVDSLRVVGSKGELRMEPAFTYDQDLVHHVTIAGSTRTTIYSARDQFGPELVAFSRAILDGEEPEPSGEEGWLDVRVLEAIAQSTRERRPVSLAPYVRRRRPSMSQEMRMPPLPKSSGSKTVHAPSPTR